ncbi:MAG TPA: ATP-binding cassette domain-containing protein [Spirochaetota bacterium]|nr:ATP-binding cassette domain-containing protein [Spirochaetota bacterium]HPC39869.1 ATP-binding cassette domain-containing protein [Spirochaetota bacterium]HPL17799.1 ATP-binding cassette domain-containing protein [Spirochaetota bacterium]HQF08955.1 ATP-binding cassette domain-containing protein [Spirochaetota bacterium]HQH98763.1 ATP-binding cassette domain-containing protein [Spirochaetota bacterium]
MKEKIVIHDLHKSFGPKVVLDGLDLTVYESEILCIIGISGVGKSVILKNLIGILEPDSGSIFVDGVEFTGADAETRRAILSKYGILFQGAALFDSLNIYDNVAFGLRRKHVPEDQIERIVPEMLENVGLRGVESKRVSELSGGMQKRVGLARSIALHPEIMLYDEPTTGVDPITGGAVDRLIKKMRDTIGVTSVVVTHDMRSAYRLADRIAMLYEGKIICTGPPDIFRNTDNAPVRQFIEGRAHGPIQVL